MYFIGTPNSVFFPLFNDFAFLFTHCFIWCN